MLNTFNNHYNVFLGRVKNHMATVENRFKNLDTNRERFNYIQKIYNEFEIPSWCLSGRIPRKDHEKSVEIRWLGYAEYFQGRHYEAQKFINKSLLYETRHEDLYIGYGIRSLINFLNRCFKDSVTDIDRVMKMEIPNDYRYTLLKRKGESLCNLGKHKEACICFRSCLPILRGLPYIEAEQSEELLRMIDECVNHEESEDDWEEVETTPDSEGCHDIFNYFNSVRLRFSAEFGRHMVAKRNILPGEVIMTEEPFSSVLLPKHYLTHCYHCLKRCNVLIPCKSCCHVMFCSDLCRNNSWNKYHEKECPLMFHLMQLDLEPIGLLTVRTILSLEYENELLTGYTNGILHHPFSKFNLQKRIPRNEKFSSKDYSNIYHLEGFTSKREPTDLLKKSVMAKCIVECFKVNPLIFSIQDVDDNQLMEEMFGVLILRHLNNLSLNARTVFETQIQNKNYDNEQNRNQEESFNPTGLNKRFCEVGHAVNAALSLLNHSCDPNVIKLAKNGTYGVIKSIRPIKKGEQLFECYGYHYITHSKNMRQENLLKQYFFECNCTACSNDWNCQLENQKECFEENMRCLYCGNGPLKIVVNVEVTESHSELYFCEHCDTTVDISLRMKKIKSSSKIFKEQMPVALNGGNVDRDFFFKHLMLLDENIVRPFKEYFECQLVIQHLYYFQCNPVYITNVSQ